MGLLISMMRPALLTAAIPAMYGLSGAVAGWIVHLSHSAILGVVFAGALGALGYEDSLGGAVALGLVYGAALWFALAVLAFPVWLQAVDFPKAPAFPNWNLQVLVPHLLYGLSLGAAYPLFD